MMMMEGPSDGSKWTAKIAPAVLIEPVVVVYLQVPLLVAECSCRSLSASEAAIAEQAAAQM
jgi:hypothetical protein